MINIRDRHIAVTYSVLTVLILRFISYTNLFGLAKNLLREIILMTILAAITAFVFYYKELGVIKRSLKFIFLYILICTVLDFSYMIFIIPDNFPIQFLLLRIIFLFSITSTVSFFLIYLINRIFLDDSSNNESI
jgi:hypothetical protein